MCLTINSLYPERKVAKEDIVCYKGYYVSPKLLQVEPPFYGNPIGFLEDVLGSTVMAAGPEQIVTTISDTTQICGGFIHLGKTKGHTWGGTVFKVVIPAGTEYYENDAEYCAKAIRIEDVIFAIGRHKADIYKISGHPWKARWGKLCVMFDKLWYLIFQ